MNTLHLQKSKIHEQSELTITGSKSESNRLLLLQALYPELQIENLSNSDDSQLMQKALQSTEHVIDIHHAGTAMRFLTAYFSTQQGRELTLTGSERMRQRPIKILVEALRQLGADITYTENKGYPPLKIKGKQLVNNKVALQANVSSQYISALLLIAPRLQNGLELTLEGEITSLPYIKMTLSLLESIGVKTNFKNNHITINHMSKIPPLGARGIIESDWSSASYFYSIVALSDVGTSITLSTYKNNSLQGDSVLEEVYKYFGVETSFHENNTVTIQKSKISNQQSPITLNLTHAPDIAQTITVTAFGLGKFCYLTGLHTLKIKETDRLVALKTELEKLGGQVIITDNSLQLSEAKTITSNVTINTYNDHRMAMAFAPLALKQNISINDYKVVSKSYPDFWDDLANLGVRFLV